MKTKFKITGTITTYFINAYKDKCYVHVEIQNSYESTRLAMLKETGRKRLLAGEPAMLKEIFN